MIWRGRRRATGFASVTVIDDDLGRSGSGSMQRPGFERLVAMVCSGDVGAVYCIEASRLARNGRDWHHLIDLCALAGALVIDPDGAYDPRLVNDRLLLGLKGTMSEYELSLMRQRGIAARDSKARRGEFRFMLPPGFCWSEAGKIEIDPDEHVAEAIRLVFAKFRELGSARQVFLWLRSADIKMPVVLRNVDVYKLIWKAPAYHSVMQILHNPLYAGAYAFGRRTPANADRRRTRPQGQRVRQAPRGMERPAARQSSRLHQLAGVRGQSEAPARERAHEEELRAQIGARRTRTAHRADAVRALRADDACLLRHGRKATPIAISAAAMTPMWARAVHRHRRRADRSRGRPADPRGGLRSRRRSGDLRFGSGRALEKGRSSPPSSGNLKRRAMKRLSPRADTNWWIRPSATSPANWRRAGTAHWSAWPNSSGESRSCAPRRRTRPKIDRALLLQLAHDLPAAWNAPSTDTRTKQRLIHILVQEIVCELDDATNEAVLLIHWTGGRHTEVRVPRVKTGRYPGDMAPTAVDALRKLAGHWPDRELAVSLNRMRCKTSDGETWTTVRVREMRERLGLPEYDPAPSGRRDDQLDEGGRAARHLRRIGKEPRAQGHLAGDTGMPGSPWLVPVEALTSEAVRIGVQRVIERRPKIYEDYQYDKVIRLPGI